MQVVYPRCCGLDIHERSVVACVLLTREDGTLERAVRTFGAMTAELLALDDWLARLGVAQVALESTGIYWRPAFNLLEGEGRTVLLGNPQRLKRVPGRKTDVRGAEWLAALLRHGLLRPSFIPPAPIRALRELTRYRKTPVQRRAAAVNRVQKGLEAANLKLAAVASDVPGASGRALLLAIPGGEAAPAVLAELARGRRRAKLPLLRQALDGRVRPHQRLLLGQLPAHIEFLEESIAQLQGEIERRLAPCEGAVELLQPIPGVSAVAAAALVAEIGADMGRFPSAKHPASWAGLCPGNKQSGGKRLSGKVRRGNAWLRALLGEAAWAIARAPGSYLHAQYHRLVRRRGKQQAVVAVAHSVLVIAYRVLRAGRPYADPGPDYFDRLDAARLERHHLHRLEQLGYTVTLAPKRAA
jgi:transposase